MTQDTTPAVQADDVRDALVAIGIEPLLRSELIAIGGSEFAEVTIGGLGGGCAFQVRFGITRHPDRTDAQFMWERRSIAESILNGDRLSAAAITLLERLQASRLPIGCSIMVWSRGIGMQQPMSRGRLLVLEFSPEFSRSTCFALCRWNG